MVTGALRSSRTINCNPLSKVCTVTPGGFDGGLAGAVLSGLREDTLFMNDGRQ